MLFGKVCRYFLVYRQYYTPHKSNAEADTSTDGTTAVLSPYCP